MKLLKRPSRPALALSVGVLAVVASTICAQQLATARADDEQTTKLVTQMISRFHIKQDQIDDDTSAALLDDLLSDLDPQKLYFMQDDVNYFQRFRNQLDDQLRNGNTAFIYQVFKVYQVRLNQRVELAHRLIDQPHDFSVDESIVIDADTLKWPQSEQEAIDRWRKRIKSDLLDKKLDGTEEAEAKDELHRRYRMVKRTMDQTEDHEKLEIYLTALAKTFDPHSSYMSPQTLEDFQIQMRLSLQGIGASLKSDDGYVTVHSVVPGGAAAKDGRLEVGDKIVAVAQADGEFVDVVEMKLTKVVRYIRGDAGTVVRLRVKTTDGDTKTYNLTRQKIELKADEVKGRVIRSGERLDGTQATVGVIDIPSFYRDFQGAQEKKPDFKSTARDVRKVLKEFEQQGGVDAVVIDLRMNGGGALAEAIEVSGLFIDQGPIVRVKNLDGSVKDHNDEERGVAYSGPLVVVVDKLSASASEIFAGVIKDYGRGIVVGDESTHGKGTVQNVMPVSQRLFQFLTPKQRGALKLTINQFYRVNGDSTQNTGVRSDVVLPSLLDHMDLGEASLDNALEFDQIDPAKYRAYSMVSPQVIRSLQDASARRIAASPEFQKVQRTIDRFVAKKNRKLLSLNFDVRKKEKEEDEREKEDEDKEDENENADEKPIFEPDHYNDEILQITVDYLGSLRPGAVVGRN